jgi:cob(I)alamin adenosyltransferase
MKFYSGKGDDGTSSILGFPHRLLKTDVRFKALGAVDELNSYLGVCHSLTKDERIINALKIVQQNLFIIQAEIGSWKADAIKPLDEEKIKELEKITDEFGDDIGEIRKFVIPGGNFISAHLDYARTLARKAERELVALKHEISDNSISYLNRLSSFLFVLARWINKKEGIEESHPRYL